MSTIIDTSDLQTYMQAQNVTIDTSLASILVAEANQIVESRTNRCWGELKSVTEHHWHEPAVFLEHTDISMDASTMTIYQGLPYEENLLLDQSMYWWNPRGEIRARALLLFIPVLFVGPSLKVTYSYGVSSVPGDLKAATLALASGFYSWAANGQKDITAAQIDTWRVQTIDSVRGIPTSPQTSAADTFATNHAKASLAIIDSYAMTRVY